MGVRSVNREVDRALFQNQNETIIFVEICSAATLVVAQSGTLRQEYAMFRALVPLALVALSVSIFAQQSTTAAPAAMPTYGRARITGALDESQRVTLKGNTHPLARPQFDSGSAPPDLPMDRMLLVLKRSPEQQAALNQLLDSQHDKNSPNYHKWLTPEAFGAQFGPPDADLQTITSWLQVHGFEVNKVAKGRTVIEFSGTAAQVEETFSTPIHKFTVKGQEHWANAADPQIPAALAPAVAGVLTMHNFPKKPMLKVMPEPVLAKYVKGQPLTTFGNPPINALAPADYATIYNINPLYTSGVNGTGRAIAVVGRSNLYGGGQDIRDFAYVFGSSSNVNVIVNGPDPGLLGSGEGMEATLDATWASAIAPGAVVDFVVSASTNTSDGVDLSEVYIIDNNLADVMTESFGTCELQQGITKADADGISALAEQAAAQGITYIVSSGDSGAEGCDDPNLPLASGPLSVNILASTPFNVAVGGTMFNENGQTSRFWSSTNKQYTLASAISYIPENVWNESCTTTRCGNNAGLWAGGGGASAYFAKPGWQSGVSGIPNDGFRDVPDVSLTAASHDPYLVCFQGSCVPDAQGYFSIWLVGGTSASAPAFAGVMALVDQKMGARQGQANYVLYRLAAQNPSTCNGSNTTTLPTTNCIFNDTTVGNNAVPGESGYGTPSAKYQSGKAYDLATGLGSVNVTNLVNKWNSVTFRASATTLVLNSGTAVNVPHGTPVDVAITVAPQSGTGTPSGDVSLWYEAYPSRAVSLFTLAGGTVSAKTNLLPGGTYPVTAHYAGDAAFGGSISSPPVSVTITAESSQTAMQVGGSFDSSGNIVPVTTTPYGSFLYMRADVAGSSGAGTPTGTVGFIDSTSGSVGSYSLNSKGNTATPSGFFTLPAGSHSLTAQYSGDSSFLSSTSSPPTSIAITPASSSWSLSFAGAPQGANLLAKLLTNSGGNPPTGKVTFSIDGNPVGNPIDTIGQAATTNSFYSIFYYGAPPVQVGAQASASFLDSSLANGAHTLTATYAGDGNYAASSSAPLSFNLQPDFSFTSGASSMSVRIGGSGTLPIAISQLDGFTGTVNFACSGLPRESSCSFNPASVKGSGNVTLTITTTAPRAGMLPGRDLLEIWLTGAVGMAGMFLVGGTAQRRRRRRLFGVILFAVAIGALGCGGGGSSAPPVQHDPGTPAGAYTVTVTASSGSLSHQVSFGLSVQ